MSGSDRIHYICLDIFKHLAVKSIVRPLCTHRVVHNMSKQEKWFQFDRNETLICHGVALSMKKISKCVLNNYTLNK